MTAYTIYNDTTGLIHSSYDSPDGTAPTVPVGHTLITGANYDHNLYYIDIAASNTPTLKPLLQSIILQDVDTIVGGSAERSIFSNIPVGVAVSAQTPDPYIMQEAVITDEILEVSYNKVGIFRVDFTNDYYVPATFYIEVT